jgi:hypothetical protein
MMNLAYSFQIELKGLPVASLGIVEFSTLDFVPARMYWLFNVPSGHERGNHAHKTLNQLLIVVSGSVEIEIFEGATNKTFNLDQSSPALRLKPGLWRVLRNFSENASVVVLCDQAYDENDYIRDFDSYLEWHDFKNV